MFGAVCVLVAGWLLLVGMRGALAEESAFRSAPACTSGTRDAGDSRDPRDPRDANCLRTVTVRIDRTDEVKGHKTPTYRLYVTEPDGTAHRTHLHGSPREAPLAKPGTTVEVTSWRGLIRYVDFPTTRRPTLADPTDEYRLFCSLGLGLAFYGAAFLWGGYRLSRRTPHTLRAYSWQASVTVAGGLCLTLLGVTAPWFTDTAGSALRLVSVGTPVVLIACLGAAVVLKRRHRGDDTLALTPAVPTEEQVIGGRVLGATPYADGGGGFLVVGPGYLASTPDPTGTTLRRETPGTLTPVRVRPPYTTDPAGRPHYGGRALVLECEDHGEEVLVVTRRQHMPTVLGALGHPHHHTDSPVLP
ncbi:hypothetical protein ABZ172_12940 [Streptomyces sp. NPDC006296]|uniref:hypothetical protein n=1 Tax=Streptomyces sp. NPDC006296 TaxID=3156746 RepID=UPI0033BA7F01